MKLSEAIRLGAMLRPQGYYAMSDDGRTCAYGAAYEAVGFVIDDETRWPAAELIYATFPLIAVLTMPCPECGQDAPAPGMVVTHLNDRHRWTREDIADWVETIEAQHASAEAVPAVATAIESATPVHARVI